MVPPYLCAIAYDKQNCGIGNWDNPLEIAEVAKLNLGFWSHFKEGNDIESVSVRPGCVLKGYDKDDLGGNHVEVSAARSSRDVHKNIQGSLKNDISSLSCLCTNRT